MSDYLLLSLSAVRGLHLAALVGLFGFVGYRLAFLPGLTRADPAGGAAVARTLDIWAWRAAMLVFASALAWMPLQAAQTAGADSWSAVWAATPILALHTGFGHAWGLRVALVIAAALAIHRRRGSLADPAIPPIGVLPHRHRRGGERRQDGARLGPADGRGALALLLCGIALLLQAEMGHAAAADAAWIRIAHGVHVLAAATWLGALVPLVLTLRRLAPTLAAQALQRFSRIGAAAVASLAGSALALAWEWSGGWVGLVSTAYGRLLLAKLAVLAGLLALAALHRWQLVPALAGLSPERARARLRITLAIEILLGLLALALAAGLATQPPGVHDTAVWPFAWRPDPAVFDDEGYARRLVQTGVMAIAAGVLLVLALLFRRLRVFGLLGSLCLLAAAPLPDPAVLVVPAYPSSFQHAPSGFDAESIALGQQHFAQHCASCHGADASGRGPRAASLPMWPPNLAGHMLWDRTDGEVFWRIGHGMRNPAGAETMPGFAGTLSEDEMWGLVNFLFANAGGASAAAHGGWAQALRAPDLQAQCRDGQALPLDELRERMVRVVAAGPDPIPPADGTLATTIVLVRDSDHRQDAGPANCVVDDPQAWNAYALVSGRTPETFAGTQLLIDRAGWLRARRVPGDARGWTAPDVPAPRKSATGGDSSVDPKVGQNVGPKVGLNVGPNVGPNPAPSVDPDADSLAALIGRIDHSPVSDRRAGHAH